jgi:hypothetical protein
MKILWAITGAGHLLKESIKTLEKLSENNQITIVTSKAAKEVLKLYGYTKNIEEIIEKNKENQLITDKQQQYSYPLSGKLTHNKYDIIINTVPHIVLNEKRLEYVRNDVLLIDLASNPGGIDKKSVKDKKLKFIWALSLPGKVAPITSAEFIKNTIYNIIKK